MMRLRELRTDDAPLMFEWMQDDSVVHDLKTNFSEKTIQDCIKFINNSHITNSAIHLAIVDDADSYMGTVSLKHIDRKERKAEFAITVRGVAMGKGFSQYAMREIIRLAFEENNIDFVYWCVSANNKRAVRFYNKQGYERWHDVPEEILNTYFFEKDLLWYCVVKKDNK